MILAIRTDNPTAELYLLRPDSTIVVQKNWLADRNLAKTLNSHIAILCKEADIDVSGVDGIIVFTGSGSFTGLRIGASVGNALAYSNNTAIVGSGGDDWLKQGVEALITASKGTYVSPRYDREPNITKPKSA
jgi:tRNA A37 threonylcarbamoyladenosine modification protein TsaB